LASDILHAENLSASAHQRTQRDLFFAFIDAAKKHGKDKEVIIDGDGRKFRYADLMQAAFALSVPIKKNTRGGGRNCLSVYSCSRASSGDA